MIVCDSVLEVTIFLGITIRCRVEIICINDIERLDIQKESCSEKRLLFSPYLPIVEQNSSGNYELIGDTRYWINELNQGEFDRIVALVIAGLNDEKERQYIFNSIGLFSCRSFISSANAVRLYFGGMPIDTLRKHYLVKSKGMSAAGLLRKLIGNSAGSERTITRNKQALSYSTDRDRSNQSSLAMNKWDLFAKNNHALGYCEIEAILLRYSDKYLERFNERIRDPDTNLAELWKKVSKVINDSDSIVSHETQSGYK